MKLNGQNRGNRFIPPVLKWPAGLAQALTYHPTTPMIDEKPFNFRYGVKKYKEYYTLFSLQTHKRNKNV